MLKDKLKKIAIYVLIFILLIFLFLLVILYNLPYKKMLNELDLYPYIINTKNISYSPLTSLTFKDLAIKQDSSSVLPIFESEDISANFHLLPLINNNLKLDINSKAYGGIIKGSIEHDLKTSNIKKITLEFNEIDISKYNYIFESFPAKVTGNLFGTSNFSLVDQYIYGTNKLTIKGPILVSSLVCNGITFPDLEFDNAIINFSSKNNVILIDKVELEGKAMLIKINGQIKIENIKENTFINLNVWIGPSANGSGDLVNLVGLLTGSQNPQEGIKVNVVGILNSLQYIPVL